MRRRVFDLTAAASLLLCVGTIALWVRSYHVGERATISTRYGRYTLNSKQGYMILTGPPPAKSAKSEDAAAKLVERISNRDVGWAIYRGLEDGRLKLHFQPEPINHSPTNSVRFPLPRSFFRPLLLALDDPERFIAPHLLLRMGTQETLDTSYRAKPDGSVALDFDGLRAALLPGPWDLKPDRRELESGGYYRLCDDPRFWSVDPSQLAAIGDQWHARLDINIGSFPIWPAALVSLVLPLLWVHGSLRRIVRLLYHACPTCGYNLTGNTSGVCPECGTPTMAGVKA